MRFLLTIIISTFLLNSCHQDAKPMAQSTATPTPLVARGVTPAEAKAAFDSAQALTSLREQRWPIAAIQGFCLPERRHNNRYQNLVAFAPRWEGTLHNDVATDFDKMFWYATVKDGRADQFSLGVRRGKDFWLLEGGDEHSLQRPPEFSPDSTKDWFVGHK